MDDLLSATTTVEPGYATGKSYTYAYAPDGTRRLTRSHVDPVAGPSTTYEWAYDVWGNRVRETFGTTSGAGCTGTAPLSYGPDNRLVTKHSFPGCSTMRRYFTDHAGHRLGETDSLGGVAGTRAQLTYTAAGQLYFSLTPTGAAGTYDYNWHWYDSDGRRTIAQTTKGSVGLAAPFDSTAGRRFYYVYDGSDVALVLARQGSTWFVRQRLLSGGVDQVLAGRYSTYGGAFQNLVHVADRGGTTLAAVQGDGTEALSAVYPGRNAFGWQDAATTSGSEASTNTETGFAGASTPNPTGGFTYLRNRWYDPASGRLLTQDPIGLAGGVNLYAYAGNNPVSYSDPYGLCPIPPSSCLGRQGADLGASFVPVLSSLHDAATLVTGKNYITGQKVGLGGRGIALVGLLTPATGGQIRGAKEALSALIQDATSSSGNWRTVGAFTEEATNKAAKGGVSVQRVIENETGDQLVEHTVLDRAGNAVDGPHFRAITTATTSIGREPRPDMYILDTLANDVEDLESILRMLNSDTAIGWHKQWGRRFTRDEVVPAWRAS